MRLEYLLLAVLLLLPSCARQDKDGARVAQPLQETVLTLAEENLTADPLTVTAFEAPRSAGTLHDFFSEGDYWWPNPEDPTGPYIRRDGETNPDNFVAHRHAMVRFSQIVGNLTSAFLLTGDKKYVEAVVPHVRAWFIDTIHLIEVAQSLLRLEEAGALPEDCQTGAKQWFTEYLDWLCTHPNGQQEMKATNNHGTCWALQAAGFARYTGNEEVLRFCSDRFKNVFLVEQMAEDGSFPRELQRTKPYGYSIFNLDAMAGLCQILSTQEDDLWEYTTPDGKNMKKALSFLLPYLQDKSAWPYGKDVMYWDEWPVAQPALIFAWKHFRDEEYYQTWLPLDHFPTNEEVVRNLPLRNPVIWLY